MDPADLELAPYSEGVEAALEKLDLAFDVVDMWKYFTGKRRAPA